MSVFYFLVVIYIHQSVTHHWQVLMSDESLTLTEASMSHTSSAVAPRGKPGPGTPGRWGSGSELSRAAGRRSDWTEGDATPAPSTPGSDSLKTGTNRRKVIISDCFCLIPELKRWPKVFSGARLHATHLWRRWWEWWRCQWRGTGSLPGCWESVNIRKVALRDPTMMSWWSWLRGCCLCFTAYGWNSPPPQSAWWKMIKA